MRTTRRAIAEHADRIGFGRVVRVHRQRGNTESAVVALGVAAIAAVVVVVEMADHDSSRWHLVVLGCAVLVWATAAWVWWGPVGDPRGRLLLVATEEGLIVWQTRRTAVRWADLRVEPLAGSSDWLVWYDDKGRRHTLAPPAVSGRRDLFRAARDGEPGSPWTARRLTGVVSFWLVTVFAVGFGGVPVAIEVVSGARPDSFGDLAGVCDGATVDQAAAHDAPGPHPVAVFVDGTFDHLAGAETTPPDAVALVACSRLIDLAPIKTCDYEYGYTVAFRQARYRVEVRVARTGRLVGEFTVEGNPVVNCSDHIWVYRGGESRERIEEIRPSEATYSDALAELVNGG